MEEEAEAWEPEAEKVRAAAVEWAAAEAAGGEQVDFAFVHNAGSVCRTSEAYLVREKNAPNAGLL